MKAMKRMLAATAAVVLSALSAMPLCALAQYSSPADDSKLVENILSEQIPDLSAQEQLMLQSELDRTASTTYYIPIYSHYTTSSVSPTTHFLAPLVPSGEIIGPGSVYFYINTNILTPDYLSSTRFEMGSMMPSSAQFGTIQSTNHTAQTKLISVALTNFSITTTTSCLDLFNYNLGEFDGSGSVTCENDLNRYTSDTPNVQNPSLALTTTYGYPARKCVYSSGDVNRDGSVDSTDANYLLGYVSGNTVPYPSRSTINAAYDCRAFELAADCNHDHTVDIMDVITLNKYILGTITTLPQNL